MFHIFYQKLHRVVTEEPHKMKEKEVLKNDAKAKALIIQGLLYNHKQTLTLLWTEKLLGNLYAVRSSSNTLGEDV